MSNLLGKGNLGKGGLGKSGLGKESMGKGLSGKAGKSSRAAPPPDAPLKAMSLLGRWGRVAQGHVAFGGGCSCGGGMGPIHMSEMEMHVLDYLAAKYLSNAAVQSLLVDVAGYKPNEAGNLGEVLKAMATRSAGAVTTEDQLSLLADLERSIDSLDEITRGG
jgi:hypothetical protein